MSRPTLPIQQLPEVEIDVRDLSFGAGGVGEVSTQYNDSNDLVNITAFVPFTIPGEKIRAQVIERKKQYIVAKTINRIIESSSRIEPPCPYFGKCGGCELQHIEYEAQLEFKLRMIRGALIAGSIPFCISDHILPIIKSDPYNYRRRIVLHIGSTGMVGFHKINSHTLIPIEKCLIAEEKINDLIPLVIELASQMKDLFSTIAIENDKLGSVVVFRSTKKLTSSQLREVEKLAKKHIQNSLIISQRDEVGGFGKQILKLPLSERSKSEIHRSNNFELSVPAGYFSQINWNINLSIIDRILQLENISHKYEVLDLYAGTGNFSLPLARAGANVTAVENDARLSMFARDNAYRNRLEKKFTILQETVENFLKAKKAKQRYDIIIADPPRSGLGSLVHSLPKSRKFVYISCSLSSFVRDLKALLAHNWQVSFIEPYDMFAQTSYVEILCVLTSDLESKA